MCSTVQDIRKSFASLRVEKKLRHKEIARFLGITEAELIDAHVGVSKLDVIKSSPQLARAVRLKKHWIKLMPMVQRLGYVISLARNTSAVHEVIGSYQHTYLENAVHKIVSDHLQLQLKSQSWEFVYLFEESKSNTVERSIQFFDELGRPVYKIFLLSDSHHWYFDEIAKRCGDTSQEPGIMIHDREDEVIEELVQGSRLNELKELEEVRTKMLDAKSLRFVLGSAARNHLPLMIMVTNSAVHQTYQGPVHEMSEMQSWLHLIGPNFNLHLDLSNIAHIYLVHQANRENIKSSIELLNDEGCAVAVISSSDHAEIEEIDMWQTLTHQSQFGEMRDRESDLMCTMD